MKVILEYLWTKHKTWIFLHSTLYMYVHIWALRSQFNVPANFFYFYHYTWQRLLIAPSESNALDFCLIMTQFLKTSQGLVHFSLLSEVPGLTNSPQGLIVQKIMSPCPEPLSPSSKNNEFPKLNFLEHLYEHMRTVN